MDTCKLSIFGYLVYHRTINYYVKEKSCCSLNDFIKSRHPILHSRTYNNNILANSKIAYKIGVTSLREMVKMMPNLMMFSKIEYERRFICFLQNHQKR